MPQDIKTHPHLNHCVNSNEPEKRVTVYYLNKAITAVVIAFR